MIITCIIGLGGRPKEHEICVPLDGLLPAPVRLLEAYYSYHIIVTITVYCSVAMMLLEPPPLLYNPI